MTESQRLWWMKMREAWVTPIGVASAVSICFVGAVLNMRKPPDHFYRIVIFSAICLAFFHFTLWCLRERTTEKSLKILEYFYLGVAFLGVLGILDVQSAMAKREVPGIVKAYVDRLEKETKCSNCWQQSVVNALKTTPYNHARLYGVLARWEERGVHEDDGAFYAEAKRLFDSLQEKVFQYSQSSENIAYERRLLGFYILVIGLSLRLTKTTAEVFEWHQSKEVPTELPKARAD